MFTIIYKLVQVFIPAALSGLVLLLRSPAVSLGFTLFFCVFSYISGVHLLLLRSQLYLWGSPSSSAFPAISLGFTFFFCIPSYISGVHLLLRSQLYLWGSPSSSAFPAISLGFTFFFCIPSYICGVHLLLLHSQLYLWGSPSSPPSSSSSSSSSSSVFPAISLGFTILGEIFVYVWVCFFFNPTLEVVTFLTPSPPPRPRRGIQLDKGQGGKG